MVGCGAAKTNISKEETSSDANDTSDICNTTQKEESMIHTAAIQNEYVKEGDTIKLYFLNDKRWDAVYANFYHTDASDTENPDEAVRMELYDEDESGGQTLMIEADIYRYNRVVFSDGADKSTVHIPLSGASSGYYAMGKDSKNEGRYVVGNYAISGEGKGQLVTTTLPYETEGETGNYDKKIWIWTPADYDANAQEAYTTIYIMDGQNLFNEDHTDGYGGWRVTDTIESAMANGTRGVILVGIDNSKGWRDSELTPPIADKVVTYGNDFTELTGDAFSEFVVNTVMPYVQENYYSSRDREKNMIVGSSSGGLEAFYIGLENPKIFGAIGAFSPAYLLFDETQWDNYFSQLDLASSDMPKLYIYNGNGDFENELYKPTIDTYKQLIAHSYGNQIYLSIEEKASHNEGYWRIVFGEFYGWLMEL